MTIRSELRKKKRNALAIGYAGFAFFVVGIIICDKSRSFPFFPFAGFAVFLIATLYVMWGIRCPRCRGNIGYVIMYFSSPFAISKKIKYCPYCGVDIDTDATVEECGLTNHKS